MKKFFSNYKIVSFLIVFVLALGGGLGYLLGSLPDNVKGGIAYGFVAFSVLPVTICIFGVKELNSGFYLYAFLENYSILERLRRNIDDRVRIVIMMGFGIVLLQVILAFCLLYFTLGYEYVILGILFGGVVSSLVYGLYVCFTVRKLSEEAEKYKIRNLKKERDKSYEESFTRWKEEGDVSLNGLTNSTK